MCDLIGDIPIHDKEHKLCTVEANHGTGGVDRGTVGVDRRCDQSDHGSASATGSLAVQLWSTYPCSDRTTIL